LLGLGGLRHNWRIVLILIIADVTLRLDSLANYEGGKLVEVVEWNVANLYQAVFN
jgi:hypothetical protein